jgi:hypothetical protein
MLIIYLFCNCSTPKTITSTQNTIETIIPTPTPGENDKLYNQPNTISQWMITTTTLTLYYPGSTIIITSTNSKGELTTLAKYIPPSIVLVVKKVVIPFGGSTYNFDRHGLWEIIISLVIVTLTLVFMVFT